jgi:GT2 family glycosyltransferase
VASALPQAVEVVVVDNGSAGEEASAVASPLGALVVRSEVNLGFAGGVDLGLRHARGELVALLNDDAVAGPGWIDAARDALSDPGVAAVTPKVVLDGEFGEIILDDDTWRAPGDARPLGRQLRSVTVGGIDVLEELRGAGVYDTERAVVDGQETQWRWTSGRRPIYVPLAGPAGATGADKVMVDGETVAVRARCQLVNHAGSFLEYHGVAGEYGLNAPDDGRFDEPAERFGFSGTAPVFRAETLRRLGGLAPQFFAYNEDTDWCLRARLAGYRIVYDPGATVRHRLSSTSLGPKSPLVRFLVQRNALLCLVRNAPVDVARHFLWLRMHENPSTELRRSVLTKLPWALASRVAMRRLWTTTPRAVWDRWAGADRTWDDSPLRPAPP